MRLCGGGRAAAAVGRVPVLLLRPAGGDGDAVDGGAGRADCGRGGGDGDGAGARPPPAPLRSARCGLWWSGWSR